MSVRELALVNSAADVAAQRSAIPAPGRIKAQIQESEYVIAASQRGQHLPWL